MVYWMAACWVLCSLLAAAFIKKPWADIVLDGFNLEETPRNLALLE